jgi:hypothetical protein
VAAILILAVLAVTDAPGPGVGASQFGALMKNFYARYRDVSFVYEGEIRYVGPKEFVRGDPVSIFGDDFQGSYAFRSDGATLQDIYYRPMAGDHIVTRKLVALINGKAEKLAVQADSKHAALTPRKFNGPPAMLFQTGSAKRLFFWWFLGESLDPENQAYEFQGWEKVDGRQCLRVELNSIPGSPTPQFFRDRFWIDMERGGHPLRYEMIVGKAVRVRIDRIKLERMNLERTDYIWMPVTSTAETFLWENTDYPYPIFRETYGMVTGSFRMNRGLPDRAFSVKSMLASNQDSTRLPFRREYERTPAFRTDPQGVQQRLDRLLREADRASKQLDASSPARSWDWTAAYSLGFTSLGLGVIAAAACWARRR